MQQTLPGLPSRLQDLFWSSSRTTFRVLPAATVLVEAVRRGGVLEVDTRFLPLLAWGYLQYRLCGRYRLARGAGSRGMDRLPDRLISTGPYALSRNPMYLGHLIFALGVALVLRSPLAAAFAATRALYFHRRVQRDEQRLAQAFGQDYAAYQRRVPRWIPGLW